MSALREAILATMEPSDEPESAEPQIVEDVAAEEAEATEVSEPEEDQATDESQEAVETEETAEAEDSEALDVSEISQYLGLDADKLDVSDSGELLIKAKIDGKETTATLNDLISSYQIKGHLNNQNMEVAELKKALTEKQGTLDSAYQAKHQEAEDLAAMAIGILNQEYNSIDWKALKEDDPAEYSVKRVEYQEHQQRIAQAYQQIQANKTTPQPDIQGEQEKLFAVIPEWKDPTILDRDWSVIDSYAKSRGFTDADIAGINDHRMLVALRDAAKYNALNQEAPIVTKRVKKAPKIAKPGTGVVKDQTSDKLKKLRAKAISGEKGAFAQYLLQTGNIK